MDMNRLTEKSQQALQEAQTRALALQHTEVPVEVMRFGQAPQLGGGVHVEQVAPHVLGTQSQRSVAQPIRGRRAARWSPSR